MYGFYQKRVIYRRSEAPACLVSNSKDPSSGLNLT